MKPSIQNILCKNLHQVREQHLIPQTFKSLGVKKSPETDKHVHIRINSGSKHKDQSQSLHPVNKVTVTNITKPLCYFFHPFSVYFPGIYLLVLSKTQHVLNGHSQHQPASVCGPLVISHCSHPCGSSPDRCLIAA